MTVRELPYAADPAALAIVTVWTVVYTWRTIVGHYGLSTSAFDVSVFDYAIWSLRHGGAGDVPFLGHSIFSHHFMPILALFVPLYAIFESPTLLLVLQVIGTAGAAVLFFVFARRIGVERLAALLLVIVFLMSRRTHGAVAGSFYPESLQALLTFAVVLTWPAGRWLFWTSLLLLLATKEDGALYAAVFAATMFLFSTAHRLRSSMTFVLACVWLVGALAVAIPASRAAEGLPRENPLIAGRYGSTQGDAAWTVLVDRLVSVRTLTQAGELVITTGGLALAGGFWLLPALPGVIVNLAADPAEMQASLAGHYAWPLLPWLFMAAAAGVVRVAQRWRRFALGWVAVLCAVTLADNPAVRRLLTTRISPEAETVRATLQAVPLRPDAVVVAQGNLIPHLPHLPRMFAAGHAAVQPAERPHVVMLTDVGNHWPMTPDEVRDAVAAYEKDAAYERVTEGRLHIFALRDR